MNDELKKFHALVEGIKSMTGSEDEELLVRGAMALEELGLLPTVPAANGSAPAPSGPRWGPHTYFVGRPGAGGRMHSAALQVERVGMHRASQYLLHPTLCLPVNENAPGHGDPVEQYVVQEKQALIDRTEAAILAHERFRELRGTLDKINELQADQGKLSDQVAALERERSTLVDSGGDVATLTTRATELADGITSTKTKLSGVDSLLVDFRHKRDRQAQALRTTANSIWVLDVRASKAEYLEQDRFTLCGLCGPGLVDTQAVLMRLCQHAERERLFRNLEIFPEVEVEPILRRLIPEWSLMAAPGASQVGVVKQQIPGMAGKPAMTVIPAPPSGVDVSPVKLYPAGSVPDGETVSPPVLVEK
jgi:hypothetical protein